MSRADRPLILSMRSNSFLKPCMCFAFAWQLGAFTASAQSPGLSKSEEAAQAVEQVKLFESHVRPLLIESCLKCHGPDKQEGNLRLDSREALLKGGDSGPAIEAGHADKSLLVSAVKHQELEMPPNKQLPDAQVATLVKWIENGAHWPASASAGLEIRQQSALGDDDRDYWAFQPLARVDVPDLGADPNADRRQNDLDAFIIAKLTEQGLTMAPSAEPLILLRRLYFDLVGVPPTPAEIDKFQSDPPHEAYERLVDRLLDDPRYGQRWGRHWLDLVRYAESDGFKLDSYRPSAYLYRDYVIDSLNRDVPYDQFVTEQLAGDELPVVDSRSLAATGYLRHWIYEYNQRDVRTQWNNILNDLTDVTGEVFLGLGLGCARCHDHKFDPILQKDYFRLQASFAAFLPRDDSFQGEASEIATYQSNLRQWESATESIRQEMAILEQPVRDKVANKAIDKFPPDIRPLLRRTTQDRDPYEVQIADLAFRQVANEWQALDYAKQLTGEAKERWQALKNQLAEFDHLKPSQRNSIMAAGETGPVAPPTFIPPQSADAEPIVPAKLEVLGGEPLPALAPAGGRSTGRRTALAAWINDPANALPHRVIVNRVWQYHFENGIVANASDFGRLGQPPTHPELLDWLAGWWLENGRSFKRLHKLIVSSATYRQASQHPERDQYAQIDNENRWLWHFPARRLDAEQVRDAMLVAAGVIDWQSGGPASEHTDFRRAIYTKVLRNKPDPLLSVLDAPDGTSTIAKRSVTTTAVQSLLLANAPLPLKVAQAMANDLRSEQPSTEEQIKLAFQRCFSRPPSASELERALQFLDEQVPLADATVAAEIIAESAEQDKTENATAGSETVKSASDAAKTEVAAKTETESAKSGRDDSRLNSYARALGDLCHVLLNSSEFLYVD